MNRIIHKITPVVPKAPKLLKVAAYARVSMEKETMLHSFSAQVSYYSEKIQKHPGWSYAGVYADRALTGTKSERPEFQRLLADCRAGKIDLVLTKSISRFARNTVTLLETVRELKALGIDVFFEEQNIHSMSGDGELMLTILASYAQEESRSVSENCTWRIRKKFEQGIPTTSQMNGLKFDHGKVEVIPQEASIIKMIFHFRLAGMGKNAISRELNELGIPAKNGGIWHESVIDTILRNEKYQGDLVLQKYFRTDHLRKIDCRNKGELPKYVVRDNHEAIIPREEFAAVQQIIQKKAAEFPEGYGVHNEFPFTRKLVCAHCGRNYQRRLNNGKLAWQCYTYMVRGKKYCPAKQIHESILESVSAQVLGQLKFDNAVFQKEIRCIHVYPENRLIYEFYDGHTKEAYWKDPSRRDSWTPEMKARAAEQMRRRYAK